MAKKRVITNTMQKVAADILQDFIICTWDGVTEESCKKFYDEVFKRYDLCDDPFTRFPCTSKEYADGNLEYQRQSMIEKYGHCDGLE